MEQWEYLPTFIEANAKDKETKEFLKTQHPDVKKPPRYMAEAMMPKLDELGAQGWELVHMEPVAGVGKKGDVLFADHAWSNTYFCVFKRRKAVQQAQYTQQPVQQQVQQPIQPQAQQQPPQPPPVQQPPVQQPPAQQPPVQQQVPPQAPPQTEG